MSCLSSQRRAELQAELLTLQGDLVDLQAAYKAAISGAIKSYKFNSGEGDQSVVMQNPKDIKDLLDETRAEINSVTRQLGGTNVMNMNLRRHPEGHPRGVKCR